MVIQTSGSILSPASFNNLVGIKPTVGLVSRYLVIPISEHQDTVGPMARSVRDAAYLLQAVAGADPQDKYTLVQPYNGTLPDYVGAACNFEAFAGKRIGIASNMLDILSEPSYAPVLDSFDAAVEIIQRAGAEIVYNANFTAIQAYLNWTDKLTVLEADFINGLYNYLSELTYNPTGVRSLQDVYNFTHSFPLEDWPERDTAIWVSILSRHEK